MKKKRGILISVSVLLLTIVLITIFLFFGEKLVTGDRMEIVKATITLEPDSNPDKRVIKVIEDKDGLDQIYQLLQETRDIEVTRYPSHSDSIQCDSRFRIEIVYNNGEIDLIRSLENPERIFRHLNTKGTSGDSGYVSGENKNLWNFLSNKEFK